MTTNLLWLIPLSAMVALTSIAPAYIITGLTPNPQTATNVGSTFSFLMFGFAGVMFPVAALPGVMPDIVPYVVPHAAVSRRSGASSSTATPSPHTGGRS